MDERERARRMQLRRAKRRRNVLIMKCIISLLTLIVVFLAVILIKDAVIPGLKNRKSSKKTEAQPETGEKDETLLAELKALRTDLAQKNHVPADDIVFNNVSLDEMAEKKPRTMGDFMRISGVGDAKARKYGSEFLKVIAAWVNEHSEN